MNKRIRIEIVRKHFGGRPVYQIVKMANAAEVAFTNRNGTDSKYGVGSEIALDVVDAFSRSKDWDTTITMSK